MAKKLAKFLRYDAIGRIVCKTLQLQTMIYVLVHGVIGIKSLGVAPGESCYLFVFVLDCNGAGSSNAILGLECILKRVLQHKERPVVETH